MAGAVAGCGGGEGEGPSGSDSSTTTNASVPDPPPALRAPPCPADASNCERASGRILYVERVDPDGDGDAHLVIADPQGITLRGLTAIDVRKGLRPHPLPDIGELVSAAGPVQTGSYGQSQIHALELHIAGR